MELSPSEAQRYTQRIFNQPARDEKAMERPFYTAGNKIDGSVIQQMPGLEIMVVDFEKDEVLKRFYEDTIRMLQEQSLGQIMYPEFLKNEIVKSFPYNRDVIDALVTGIIPPILESTLPPEKLGKIKSISPLRDQKFYVGSYITLGYMTCRQMGVIAAACMERFANEQEQKGGSYWRHVEYHGLWDAAGGHAWATAEKPSGAVVVVDPASDYCGSESGSVTYDYSRQYQKKPVKGFRPLGKN